jgi:hypothetical protein
MRKPLLIEAADAMEHDLKHEVNWGLLGRIAAGVFTLFFWDAIWRARLLTATEETAYNTRPEEER